MRRAIPRVATEPGICYVNGGDFHVRVQCDAAAHIVAFCGDLGISAARAPEAVGVACSAFVFAGWGGISDRIAVAHRHARLRGQLVTISAFLVVQADIGSRSRFRIFGLGFSG